MCSIFKREAVSGKRIGLAVAALTPCPLTLIPLATEGSV